MSLRDQNNGLVVSNWFRSAKCSVKSNKFIPKVLQNLIVLYSKNVCIKFDIFNPEFISVKYDEITDKYTIKEENNEKSKHHYSITVLASKPVENETHFIMRVITRPYLLYYGIITQYKVESINRGTYLIRNCFGGFGYQYFYTGGIYRLNGTFTSIKSVKSYSNERKGFGYDYKHNSIVNNKTNEYKYKIYDMKISYENETFYWFNEGEMVYSLNVNEMKGFVENETQFYFCIGIDYTGMKCHLEVYSE